MSAPVVDSTSAAFAPASYTLGPVRAVLPDRVLDDAVIAVEDGVITAVEARPPGVRCALDGHDLFCLPGVVDLHSDALEREARPRPNAELPMDFALASFEGKLAAAGITTVFHGAGFEEGAGRSFQRTVKQAEALCDAVDAAVDSGTDAMIDHRILYRLDVRCEHGLAALQRRLAAVEATGAADVAPLVSHEDHTPGQGQYADRRYYERYMSATRGLTEAEAVRHVDELIAERAAQLDQRDVTLDWLGGLARAGRITLVGHDPATTEEIDDLAARSGRVAEFPTRIEAARAARERSMPVVAGAPNLLRGGSHAGNVSAAELVAAGLVTAVASDYLPSGLIGSAFHVVEQGLTDLPTAVGLVTSGPADAAGLADRGRLAPGLRADLVLVRGPDGGRRWPTVRRVLRA